MRSAGVGLAVRSAAACKMMSTSAARTSCGRGGAARRGEGEASALRAVSVAPPAQHAAVRQCAAPRRRAPWRCARGACCAGGTRLHAAARGGAEVAQGSLIDGHPNVGHRVAQRNAAQHRLGPRGRRGGSAGGGAHSVRSGVENGRGIRPSDALRARSPPLAAQSRRDRAQCAQCRRPRRRQRPQVRPCCSRGCAAVAALRCGARRDAYRTPRRAARAVLLST